jgi:hypothetical protein
MSTRLQISDVKNNLLTVQLSQDISLSLDQKGTWMPDYPGKVRSGTDWDGNPWEAVPTGGQQPTHFADAVCYTFDNTQTRILVMRFNGAFQGGSHNVLSKGSGYLYASGTLTMAEGILTWANLDFVLSDSADDGSDSGSDGSDDDGDGGDSAYG